MFDGSVVAQVAAVVDVDGAIFAASEGLQFFFLIVWK